jgi:hypothetical protein
MTAPALVSVMGFPYLFKSIDDCAVRGYRGNGVATTPTAGRAAVREHSLPTASPARPGDGVPTSIPSCCRALSLYVTNLWMSIYFTLDVGRTSLSVVFHNRPSGYFQMGDLFAVCNPPVGLFDARCPQLLWRTTTYKNKAYLLASIPVNCVPDFIGGEELRGHCLYMGKPYDIPDNLAITFFAT